jgi:hypothetical protein
VNVVNLLALLVLLRATPILITVYMFLGQPLLMVALILLLDAVLASGPRSFCSQGLSPVTRTFDLVIWAGRLIAKDQALSYKPTQQSAPQRPQPSPRSLGENA